MKSESYFDYSNAILSNIEKHPKSVKEISADTEIPLSAVYKTIRILETHQLVIATGVMHKHGKYRLFQCNGDLRSAHLKLHRIFQIELA